MLAVCRDDQSGHKIPIACVPRNMGQAVRNLAADSDPPNPAEAFQESALLLVGNREHRGRNRWCNCRYRDRSIFAYGMITRL